MREENYRQSIDKWKGFRRLIKSGTFRIYLRAERNEWWDENIWTACGFCQEFAAPTPDEPCEKCPLSKKHCYYSLAMDDNFTIKKIYYSFMSGDDETTLKLIDSLIKAMNQYKHYEVKK